MPSREDALRNLALANEAKARMVAQRRAERAAGKLSTRHQRVLMLSLGGANWDEIAKRTGFNRKHVGWILRSPPVRAEQERILAAQRERCVAGEFGVQAMARAAAPRMAETIIRQATGDGVIVPPNVQLRAAELGLKLSGDLVERKTHEHVVSLIRDLTTDELEHYQRTRQLPKRITDSLSKLGIRAPTPAIEYLP